MKIDSKIIAALKPCKDRFDNYVDNYGDTTFSLEDFILLDKITYDDKVWVVTRLFSREQNAKWSLLCASSILSIFESKYPDDKRPRKALEAAELYLRHPTEENRKAAKDAADTAADAAIYSAADADYSAAYFAASDAAYAAYSAAKAAANSAAAVDAAYSANTATATTEQQEVNLIFMAECAKESKI